MINEVVTINNIYYRARKKAAKIDARLNSRAGASELLHIDTNRLNRVETDVKEPYADEVAVMSKVYEAPELLDSFCAKCPVGCELGIKCTTEENSYKTLLQLVAALKETEKGKNKMLDILADGVIDETEEEDFNNILSKLEELNKFVKRIKRAKRRGEL